MDKPKKQDYIPVKELKDNQYNGIRIGEWELDVYLNDNGTVGITVYQRGTGGDTEHGKAKDIIVDDTDDGKVMNISVI